MSLSKKEKMELDKKGYERAAEIKRHFNLNSKPINDLFTLVESKGFLLLRFPNTCGISGIYMEKNGGVKIYKCIYINNNEPKGRQSFTLAHELYHSFYEKSNQMVCLQEARGSDPIEFTAERFASYLLIDRDELIRKLSSIRSSNISYGELFYIQKYFRVSFQALIYAISTLEFYPDLKRYIPRNIGLFKRYYKEANWEKLNELIQKNDPKNDLNSSSPEFYFPNNFRMNLFNNYAKGRTDLENIKEFFEFFNEEFNPDSCAKEDENGIK